MRFSVVINTLNRAESLRLTLSSLRYQTYPDFEVIVVNGPSVDGTDRVIGEFDGQIRALRCRMARLSVSRNIGLAAASGDVVAFIDDDAIPTPHWLEELAEEYQEPNVGAVGGLVYDHTGVILQYRFTACHRDGQADYDVHPPLDRYRRPMADPVAYLQGTNMSFSRPVLEEIGGFDENILHYYDDVETCMQVIDRGYKLKALERAAVHHKFLASHIRNHKRMTVDPFNHLCDRIYFALQHGRGTRSTRELITGLLAEADKLRAEADTLTLRGEMTADQRDFHHRRLNEAVEVGLAKGLASRRAGRDIPPADTDSFLQFPTLRPAESRLKLCFVSREYPPGDFGGPGRYSHEMAAGFASYGHEVHVVTRSPDIYRLDFEEGVWVHRLPDPDRLVPELDGVAAKQHLFNLVGAYHEVCRIHADRPVDLVSAPLWLCEGLVCGFDDRFPTTTTLITAMKAVAGLARWAKDSPECQQLVRLEEELVAQSNYLHAVSQPILERAAIDYHADPERAFVANLGLRDRSNEYHRRRPSNGPVRILYVGRIETRKGADLFLEAAARLCQEFPDVEFVLAGKEIPTDEGDTHRQRFETRFAGHPEIRTRVTFTGIVSEEELYQHYADADVVCLPSFYESFGLVFVEAMIFGKPVVGTRVGGVVEVVADGQQGYLVPPGDADSLTDALRRLIADPSLRARFGRRSRELYLERFSIPVMVSTAEKHFRSVIARHRARTGWNPKAAPPRQQVARYLADTLVRAVGVTLEQGRVAADRLLDDMHHPVDLPRQFQKVWHLPPHEFLEWTYRILFARPAQPEEIEEWAGAIYRAGLCRIDVLRVFAGTPDAKRRGPQGDWVGQLETACGLGVFDLVREEVAPIPTPVAPPRPVRQRLSEMKYIGKFLKYARRLVYMPWGFHKFYHQFGNGEHIIRASADQHAATELLIREQLIPLLRQLLTRQEGLRDLLWKKEITLATGQAELREAINEQIARISESIGGIEGVIDYPVPELNGELPALPELPAPGKLRQAG